MREYGGWGCHSLPSLFKGRESAFRRGWLIPHRPKMNPVSMVSPSVNAELMFIKHDWHVQVKPGAEQWGCTIQTVAEDSTEQSILVTRMT